MGKIKPTIKFDVIFIVRVRIDSPRTVREFIPEMVKYPLFRTSVDPVDNQQRCKAFHRYVASLDLMQLDNFLSELDCQSAQAIVDNAAIFSGMPFVSFATTTDLVQVRAYVTPSFDSATNTLLSRVDKRCQPIVKEEVFILMDDLTDALEKYMDEPMLLKSVVEAAEITTNQRALLGD